MKSEKQIHMQIRAYAWKKFTNGFAFYPSPSFISFRLHEKKLDWLILADDFSNIGSAKNTLELRIIENLHIWKRKTNLNEMISAFPLKFFHIFYVATGIM